MTLVEAEDKKLLEALKPASKYEQCRGRRSYDDLGLVNGDLTIIFRRYYGKHMMGWPFVQTVALGYVSYGQWRQKPNGASFERLVIIASADKTNIRKAVNSVLI